MVMHMGLGRSVVSIGVASAIVVGALAAQASPRNMQLAQATPAPAPASQPRIGPLVQVEARIADLRAKLKITAAQEPLFASLSDIMRANAQSLEALLQERSRETSFTAVTALQWYERLTEDHAAALKKFVPALEALYATLSDSQRKAADAIFLRFAERPPSANSK